MLQRLDVPIQSLANDTTTLHMDYLPSIVSAFKRCKNSLENDRRLENFSWRLWRRASTQSATSTESMKDTWSSCSYDSSPTSSSSSFSLSSNPSTFIDVSAKETALIGTTELTSPCSDTAQQQNNHTPKILVSEFKHNHADFREIQSPLVEDDTHHDDDDESTLFGDDNDEIENTDIAISLYWPCYEFTKKQAPSVDHQRSLLSSMLLHDASPAPIKMKSSMVNSSATLSTYVDDVVLSTSMKQHVDWEKLQNGGPAAGLMGISKNIQKDTNPSMTIVCDSLDTFTGCW